MPFVDTKSVSQLNFLASGRFQAFTEYVDSDTPGAVTDDRGRLVVPAGTIFPANDATAKGVVLNEVDVTTNAQPVAVIVEGYLLQERLPVAPTDEAKAAMPEIKWRDATAAPADAGTSDPES